MLLVWLAGVCDKARGAHYERPDTGGWRLLGCSCKIWSLDFAHPGIGSLEQRHSGLRIDFADRICKWRNGGDGATEMFRGSS